MEDRGLTSGRDGGVLFSVNFNLCSPLKNLRFTFQTHKKQLGELLFSNTSFKNSLQNILAELNLICRHWVSWLD